LKLPEKLEVVASMALGYSRRKFDLLAKILHLVRPKKKFENIASFEIHRVIHGWDKHNYL